MPFADPGLALACAALLQGEPACDIATLIAPEADASDRANPDVVKAVVALGEGERHGRALYFTRSTLYGDAPVWRHIGLYGYRRAALERFCAAAPSPLERREKLEQLRALEMGLQIWAAVIDAAPLSVDNPDDLAAARALAG
jgi:3-deoxy-manno-octulosonate cytidylyltransferase (CMP-KDO synthetase)